MPSITKSELDRIAGAETAALQRAELESRRADRAEQQVKQFNVILNKIIKAADGQPLHTTDSYRTSYHPGMAEMMMRPRPDLEERLEQDVQRLVERNTQLEAQLAAVRAVAAFAMDHKS